MFNQSIKNNYTNSFDNWYTGGKFFKEGLEFQIDIGWAQNINSPKYLLAAQQSLVRFDVPNKANIKAIFDNLIVRVYFVGIDGQRYPKDVVITNNTENDYFDQYRDLEIL